MGDILRDFEPAQLALALDENYIDFARFICTLPQARFHEEPGLSWFETGVPLSFLNGVIKTQQRPEQLSTTIKRIHTYFAQRHLPFHWHIGSASEPANFHAQLEEQGIAYDESEPGMALDLQQIGDEVSNPIGLEIQPVTNSVRLRQWIEVWGCGAPPEINEHFYQAYNQLSLEPGNPYRLYLGLLNDQPVATAALFQGKEVASIRYIVTIHAARRQGIGSIMTRTAALEARRLHYRVAVLTASPQGRSVYENIGFRPFCTVSTYEWWPARG
ncbi:hypothetical protein KDA_43610 [Dictyobacter alpinus]|uniref:N-acetyltransferase domain-containing protein n=1 Tax=Dictyobacter alpinus TaxID=2014873 RepID=A0A402BC67_9CHLR|nr:GNAT family N-acetyltransferase [Dictyobacter alpinus]GCE28877.1 hypothetical protein KDA_43610 [Dictyobacter alpinus]